MNEAEYLMKNYGDRGGVLSAQSLSYAIIRIKSKAETY